MKNLKERLVNNMWMLLVVFLADRPATMGVYRTQDACSAASEHIKYQRDVKYTVCMWRG